MKFLKKFIIIVVILGIIGGGGWFFYQKNQVEATSASAVTTTTVTRQTIVSELTSSGNISPKDTYEVTALVEGEIILADFEEGDQVVEDQIMFQVDVSSMESEVTSVTNSLTRAQKDYDSALEDYEEAVGDYSAGIYYATRTGFISELSIQAGDKVGSNTTLLSLYNDQTMKIVVPFLNVDAVQIPIGSQAVVRLSDTGEELLGSVTAVSNRDEVLDGGRLVRKVTIEVANPGGLTTEHLATAWIGDGYLIGAAEGTFEATVDTTMISELPTTVNVASVLVNEGDYITTGTPIFRIETSDVDDVIRVYENSLEQAEDTLEKAQSSYDSTEEEYENYTITAPISGRVISKDAKVGDNITTSNSSSTTLATIYDLSEVTFEMSVDELDVNKVKVGQVVEVTADALEGVIFEGKVTNVSLASSQSNGVTNYPVTITISDVGGLLPGMNVDGVITLDSIEEALAIPVDALMRGNRVYIKDDSVKEAEGTVPAGFRSVAVEVGLITDEWIEVLSGIEEGDEIYRDQTTLSSTTDMMMPGMMGGQMSGGQGMSGSGPGSGGGGPR